MSDRYLRIVLTVIAIELAWIGLKDVVPTPAAAQAQQAATPVIIRGFEPQRGQPAYVPVAIAGELPVSGGPLRQMHAIVDPGSTPLRTDTTGTVNARLTEPVRVQTSESQPLVVKAVPTSSSRPGL
ncbi:MAG TPA: hypothetical protein VL173_10660 [Vicinamibacterales bacterium]|jgi:hypothetical protein|nr:hypothetical protein [Vicinamibacterales bacterium]